MDQQDDQDKEEFPMLQTNIKQFIEAARQHFFDQTPIEAAETDIPTRTIH